MPYASDAQRKKFHAMEDRGEISSKTVKEWDAKSKGKKLPTRVHHEKRAGLAETLVKESGEKKADMLKKPTGLGFGLGRKLSSFRNTRKFKE